MAGKHAKPRQKHTRNAVIAAFIGGGAAIPLVASGTASAATLGPAQIAAAAKAGCPQLTPSALNVAVKIAEAESGGRTDAVGDNGNSDGLWQIYRPAHPDLYPMADQGAVGNARAMCVISGGGTHWGDWTTYVNGAYLGEPGYTGSVTPTPSVPVTRPPVVHPTPGHHTVTVKPGDTLWGLSPGHDWRHTWALNPTIHNPNLIYPGEHLAV